MNFYTKSIVIVFAFLFKDVEPQAKLVIDFLVDCVKNKYIPPEPESIKFNLYTRNNLEVPEVLTLPNKADQDVLIENDSNYYPNDSIEFPDSIRLILQLDPNFKALDASESDINSRYFNVLTETKVFIHGFNQSSKNKEILQMKDEYLKKDDYNVIIVDWSSKSKSLCYPRVTTALPDVGRIVAKFIDQLVMGGASLDLVHLIGFSLGAHIAGHTGVFVDGRVRRITGLDPASPFIKSKSSLDAADALLVDLIHTSTDFFGKGRPLGHVDFYPNGGRRQPGCGKSRFNSCSHSRAVQFFTESISSTIGFPAVKCTSWWDFMKHECNTTSTPEVLMGDPCPLGLTGSYFLETGDKSPFAKRAIT